MPQLRIPPKVVMSMSGISRFKPVVILCQARHSPSRTYWGWGPSVSRISCFSRSPVYSVTADYSGSGAGMQWSSLSYFSTGHRDSLGLFHPGDLDTESWTGSIWRNYCNSRQWFPCSSDRDMGSLLWPTNPTRAFRDFSGSFCLLDWFFRPLFRGVVVG